MEYQTSVSADRTEDPEFRTIGEVAKSLSVPQHVIRFWETKFKAIKPVKRKGGHRYFRKQDIDLLNEIKALLYEKGFTIKGAQKYLSEGRSKPASFTVVSNSSEPVKPESVINVAPSAAAKIDAPKTIQHDLFGNVLSPDTTSLQMAKKNEELKKIHHKLLSLRDMLKD